MDEATRDDDFQDHIQRLINEHKRQELKDKYGMDFSSMSDSDLSPEMESEWLDYVDEFERQYEHAEQVPLRQFIRSPNIRTLKEIPPAEVEETLNQLVDILANYGIVVDFLYDVEPAEAYRFITEELLEEEIDDISIPGTRLHFIYEEFHPNDVEDAKQWAQEFIDAFLGNDDKGLTFTLKDRESLDSEDTTISPQTQVTRQQMRQSMVEFHSKHEDVSDVMVKPLKCKVEGDSASVELSVSWKSKEGELEDEVANVHRVSIRLERSPFGGWDVIQADMPGLV